MSNNYLDTKNLTFEEIMTQPKYKTVSKCRLCECSETKIIFDFGLSPLANKFKTTKDEPELEFPLRYFKCLNCHSVQLADEVDSNILFDDYLYESPPNLIPHFKELAETCFKDLGLKQGDLVVDIGSNNGLLLQEFKRLGCEVLGIEPAKKIAEKANAAGIRTISEYFTLENAKTISQKFGKAKLITSTNCFAHLSNLSDFVDGVKYLLDDDNSSFVFENAYLGKTLQNLDFGQAYFEHFYMHSVTPLYFFFWFKDLLMYNVTENNVQMGSVRCFVRKNKNVTNNKNIIDKILQETILSGIFHYTKFIQEIDFIKFKLTLKLSDLKREGKTISIYGWPAKMTLLAKYFDISKYIDYVVEESPTKVGKYCPGTQLEVKDRDYFINNPTDYCIIGAYNFEEDIKKKNQQYNGTWINPLKV